MFLLSQINSGNDINSFVKGSIKLETLCFSLQRKGLITEDYKITLDGKAVLEFIETETAETIVKPVQDVASFDLWWKTYPGTDTFSYRGKNFSGSRSLRVKKDDCKKKFASIISEGAYTPEEMIAALEYEIKQKKEASLKTKTNKISFMQNSLTYLNQRSFEPFIELIKEGKKVEETNLITGGTDI